MRHLSIFCLCIILTVDLSQAQTIPQQIFKNKGDSILIRIVGKEAFDKHFIFHDYSYFEYVNNRGKLKSASYFEKVRGFNRMSSFFFRYGIRIDELDYQHYISFSLKADGTNTIHHAEHDIPKYMQEGKSCDLMNKQAAIELARERGVTSIDGKWVASLGFNERVNSFTWDIHGTAKVLNPDPKYYYAWVYTTEFDARTGEVITPITKTTFGVVH
jgi:hypothetical protein